MDYITLENKNSSELIEDVIMHPLKVNRDESGILTETLRKDWSEIYGEGREFSMQYFSVTMPLVARDEDLWHYHPTVQEDRFIVSYGKVVTAIGDNREDSSTKGLLNLFLMDSENEPYILLIPKRTLHGFMVVSNTPAVLLNFPTALYNPQEEGRIPHQEADMRLPDKSLFTWESVRKDFSARK